MSKVPVNLVKKYIRISGCCDKFTFQNWSKSQIFMKLLCTDRQTDIALEIAILSSRKLEMNIFDNNSNFYNYHEWYLEMKTG